LVADIYLWINNPVNLIIMVDIETARQMAMALPGTGEKDHFGIPSFRANNRIFSTLWVKENRMMVKLPPIEQSVFNSFNPDVFYPVPNKWGLKGATFVELSKVRPDMLEDALSVAWAGTCRNKQ
jgi:hypothetical protein